MKLSTERLLEIAAEARRTAKAADNLAEELELAAKDQISQSDVDLMGLYTIVGFAPLRETLERMSS